MTSFGDPLRPNMHPHELLIGFMNIQTLPQSRAGQKNFDLTGLLQDWRFDHFGLAETGRNWFCLPEDDRLPFRLRGHFPSRLLRCTTAHNRHDRSGGQYQMGGVASLTLEKAVGHLVESGSDPSGLGRWSWQRLRGKGGAVLRVVTAYRPVPAGPSGRTVYAQHLKYFADAGNIRCPREAFLQDLEGQVTTWREEGDQLLFMADMNEHVLGRGLRKFFTQLGMRELILDKHGAGPATTRSNNSDRAIDGIWGTAGVAINAGGYLPFYSGPKSDHRILWIKVSYQVAFGSLSPPSRSIATRRLLLRDKRSVRTYLSNLAAFADAHQLGPRAQRLFDQLSEGDQTPTTEQWEEFQAIASLRHQGRLRANEQCRRLHMSRVRSSPSLKQAQLRLTLLSKLRRRADPSSKIRPRTLEKLAKKTDRVLWLSLSQSSLKTVQRSETRAYKKLKAKSTSLRSTYLEELARDEERAGNGEAATLIHRKIKEERQRERNARLRRINPKGVKRAVDRLIETVPLPGPVQPGAGQRSFATEVEYSEQGEVVDCALRTVAARSRMSEDTPPMVPPLVHLLQYDGMTPFGDEVLRGTFNPPVGIDDHTTGFLRRCKSVSGRPPPIAEPFSLEAYQQDCLRLREKTTSGPSDITPAMIKAEAQQEELLLLDYHLANFTWTTGRPPPQWLHGLDLLIYKEFGNNRAEKLRPILLFDIEANMHNKRLGRFAMRKAEDAKAVAWEQFGSRRHHAADLQALNTRLFYDQLRLTRRPATTPFVDLVSNYDLVVHSVASLALQRMGVPKAPIKAMLTTLQDMVHTCRTVFGDSLEQYGGKVWAVPLSPPPQGLGQGNGAAPTIWALVSTPLLDQLRAAGHGVVFKCCLSGETFHLVGYAFVDDTTLVSVAPSPDWTTEQVMERSQRGLDMYVGGVRATGGTVHPKKSKWYLVEFGFDNQGKWRYVDNDAELFVTTRAGREPIERLPTSVASRILGVYMAPDGNQSEQIRQLRAKTEAWADRVRSGHLARGDAWHYFQSTIKRTMAYPLAATTLTEADCRFIEAPAITAALQLAGVASNMARDVVYGPDRFLGLGHGALYHSQEMRHIQVLLDHGNASSPTGHQLRALLEGHKLEIGCGGPLFACDHDTFGAYATKTWITDTWRYLWKERILVEERTPNLQLQRANDVFIMELFARAGYSRTQLGALNRCRMYLRATTLADITDGAGRAITPRAWAGELDLSNPHDFEWPPQPSLPTKTWKLWREALQTALQLGRHGIFPTSRQLGGWLVTAKRCHWIHAPDEDRIYHREPNGWRVFPKIQTVGRRRQLFRSSPSLVAVPPVGRRAVVQEVAGGRIRLLGSAAFESPQPTTTSSFLEQCREGSCHRRWATETVESDDEGRTVARAIQEGSAIAVSDGSTKDNISSAGFVIEGPVYSVNRICGDCMVPGLAVDQNSYRAELAGLYAIVCVLEILCRTYGIKKGSIKIGCDGLSAIRKALDEESSFSCQSAQFDLLSAVEAKLRALPITVEWRHIDGHQDEGKFIGPLDRWAQLNVEMDALAKFRWATSASIHSPFHGVEGELWRLSLDTGRATRQGVTLQTRGTPVVNALSERLVDFTTGSRLVSYWSKKGIIPAGEGARVDWRAVGQGRDAIQSRKKIWLSKLASDHCAVNARMHERRLRDSPTCPRGCDSIETSLHVLSCPAGDECWDRVSSILEEWGRMSGGDPAVMPAIVRGLGAWRRGFSLTGHEREFGPMAMPLRLALEAQSRLGWGSLLLGLPSTEWAHVQDVYFKSIHSRRSGRRWVTELIQKLWDVAWDLWAYRTYQLDDRGARAQRFLALLDQRVRFYVERGPFRVPPAFRPLIPTVPDPVVSLPAPERLAWLDTVETANRFPLPPPRRQSVDQYVIWHLRKGGLLAHLKKKAGPPRLRTRAGKPHPRREVIPRDECDGLDHDLIDRFPPAGS